MFTRRNERCLILAWQLHPLLREAHVEAAATRLLVPAQFRDVDEDRARGAHALSDCIRRGTDKPIEPGWKLGKPVELRFEFAPVIAGAPVLLELPDVVGGLRDE